MDDIMFHHWKTLLLSYYEDWKKKESYADVRYMADMACMLIPAFLRDMGIKTIEITRVDYYNNDIDWDEFKEYMEKEHPYIKINIFQKQLEETKE